MSYTDKNTTMHLNVFVLLLMSYTVESESIPDKLCIASATSTELFAEYTAVWVQKLDNLDEKIFIRQGILRKATYSNETYVSLSETFEETFDIVGNDSDYTIHSADNGHIAGYYKNTNLVQQQQSPNETHIGEIYDIKVIKHDVFTYYYIYNSNFNWFDVLITYLILEIMFYARYKYLNYWLNKNVSLPRLNNLQRKRLQKLFNLSMKYARYYPGGPIEWLKSWFHNVNYLKDIHEENVYQFIEYSNGLNVSKNKTKIPWKEHFISDAINRIEQNISEQLQRPFSFNPGFNDAIRMKLYPLNPIYSLYRPLFSYILLELCHVIMDGILHFVLGFECKRINGIRVWYKLHKNRKYNYKEDPPCLMLHGLGSHNIISYLWLVLMIYNDANKDVFFMEMPWASMSISNLIPMNFRNNSFLSDMEPLDTSNLISILQKFEYDIYEFDKCNKYSLNLEWICIGHSYGAARCGGIYNNLKDCNVRLILIDPPNVINSHPAAADFKEITATDLRTQIFQMVCMGELQISFLCTRHYPGIEYAIYPENLIEDSINHVIVYGTKDSVIPHDMIDVSMELLNLQNCAVNMKSNGKKRLKLLRFEGNDHGDWLFNISQMKQIVSVI